MEASYNTFYHSYLKEYHYVKALYLQKSLNDIDELNEYLKTKEFHSSLTKNTKFIIQSDIRQNYFHCIETFFEFFFAFLPKADTIPDNKRILNNLVNSNWRSNYKKIRAIANGKMKLDILDKKIDFGEYRVSIGHYLFYIGIFSREKFDEELFKGIDLSVLALKKGILEIAKDFENRDEYNAYKHALRVFPNFKSIELLNTETKKLDFKWDISNSASFQVYNEKENKTIIKTKLFDPKRDVKMTLFCSNMIQNMVLFRDISFNKSKKPKKTKVAIKLFSEDAIDKCLEHNVEVQDISFITEKIHQT